MGGYPLTPPLTCPLSSFLSAPLATRQLQVCHVFPSPPAPLYSIGSPLGVLPRRAPRGLWLLWMDQTKVGGG